MASSGDSNVPGAASTQIAKRKDAVLSDPLVLGKGIQDMPAEILAMIFRWAPPADEPGPFGDWDAPGDILSVLVQVCRRFRLLCLDNPLLWTNVHSTAMSVPAFRMHLTNSRNFPLHMTMAQEYFKVTYDEQSRPWSIGPNFDAALPEMARVKTLEFTWTDPECSISRAYDALEVLFLEERPFPQLESLKMRANNADWDPVDDDPEGDLDIESIGPEAHDFMCKDDCPRLKSLFVEGDYFPWCILPAYDHITVLQVQFGSRAKNIAFLDLYLVLANMRSLQKLTLRGEIIRSRFTTPEFAVHAPGCLKSLTHVHIMAPSESMREMSPDDTEPNDEWLGALCRALDTPNLEVLRLENMSEELMENFARSMPNTGPPRYPALRSLYVDRWIGWSDWPELMELSLKVMHAMPNIELYTLQGLSQYPVSDVLFKHTDVWPCLSALAWCNVDADDITGWIWDLLPVRKQIKEVNLIPRETEKHSSGASRLRQEDIHSLQSEHGVAYVETHFKVFHQEWLSRFL